MMSLASQTMLPQCSSSPAMHELDVEFVVSLPAAHQPQSNGPASQAAVTIFTAEAQARLCRVARLLSKGCLERSVAAEACRTACGTH